ncbi:MAG TPA: heme ABC transporter ATP-binding protein [Candidatus Binataceae bacterium]|jgi:iron complex transport system ATP-binding protein|nr:heme ABC transporter ATP-binding protein [Candidatus Binataceae bacterium]
MKRAGADAAPAVQVVAIDAGYGGRTVLHDVSLEAQPGELLAILGPNGAGKSTLLRVLAGTLKPTRGAVTIFGRALERYERRELARTVAIVAQENLVAFPYSVIEIVLMGRAPHLGSFRLETAHDLAVAAAALRQFDLLELADRPIHEVSGGERKRVFLARAMAQEARVMLLDEPTAYLDLRHVADIFAGFHRLCRESGMTIIVTLHDLNAAALYADRVLILKSGRCAGYGPPAETLTGERLSAVYETDIQVMRSPSGRVFIVHSEQSRIKQ